MLAIVVSVAVTFVLCGGPQRFSEWWSTEAKEQSKDDVLTAENAIAILAQPDGGLQLFSFREITEDAAKEVARHNGIVDLSGLRSLSPSAASHLAGLPEMSTLILDGLEILPISSAKALASCRCRGLRLGGLKKLTPGLAAALADYGSACTRGSNLKLNGISRMAADVTEAISQSRAAVLDIRGLRQLDPDGAAALAEFRGEIIYLDGIQFVSTAVCEALSNFRGSWFSLSGVRELSPSAARSLAKFTGRKLFLDGLDHPSEEVLTLLHGFKGELVLSNATDAKPQRQEKDRVRRPKPEEGRE